MSDFWTTIGDKVSSFNMDDFAVLANVAIEHEKARNSGKNRTSQDVVQLATTETTTETDPNKTPVSAADYRKYMVNNQASGASVPFVEGLRIDKNILLVTGGVLAALLIAKFARG